MTFLNESVIEEIQAVEPVRAVPAVEIFARADRLELRIEGEFVLESDDVEVVLGAATRYARSMFGPVPSLTDDDITEAAAYAAWQDAMEDDQ